jgi:hypothetical protein
MVSHIAAVDHPEIKSAAMVVFLDIGRKAVSVVRIHSG